MAHDAKSRGPVIETVVIVFLALSWLTVLLRIFVRTKMINSLGWDDATMAIAVMVFTADAGVLIKQVSLGAGSLDVSIERMQFAIDVRFNVPGTWITTNLTQFIIAGEALYLATLMFLKISLGIFFLRIVIRKWQRRTIYVVMALSTAVSFAHIWIVVFLCGNPKHYLVNYLADQCISRPAQKGLLYEQASTTTLTDFIFASMPLPILWNAQMNTRTKISVGFVLLLGAAGSICSIVRFFYVEGLVNATEFFWSSANITIWSTVELGIGIVAGNLATLRPLFKRIFKEAKTLVTAHYSLSGQSHSYGWAATGGSADSGGGAQRNRSANEKTLLNSSGDNSMQFSRKSSVQVNPMQMALNCATAPWEGYQGGTTTTCVGGPAVNNAGAQSFYDDTDEIEQAPIPCPVVSHEPERGDTRFIALEMDALSAPSSAGETIPGLLDASSTDRIWTADPERDAVYHARHVSAGEGITKVVDIDVREQARARSNSGEHTSEWEKIELAEGEQVWVRKQRASGGRSNGVLRR
ncbi:hypothetical protein NA57DRAFT_51193 [Rhizodiscina lignyota]|uniref:Rhodopsin domain-containing protein n=1 Tax=Rhizodiscina lignyota TaxID=1504668 RepID=A0A9P4IMP3_9PEZI|nr:hypothetical protein NA57DRAFT_51193 [Rhizodiscina lignyota]